MSDEVKSCFSCSSPAITDISYAGQHYCCTCLEKKIKEIEEAE